MITLKKFALKSAYFFVFLTIFIISPALADAATLSVTPATGTINLGCNFAVNVMLDTTGTQTDGTDVILKYEPSKLTVGTSNISNGKIYQDYPGNSIDTTTGKISISGISSVATPFNGSGIFATVNFKVSSAATVGSQTFVRFDFDPNDKTLTTDTNVVERGTIADVLASVTDGTYTIGNGPCSQSATATSNSSAISSPATSFSGSTQLPQGQVGSDSSQSGSLPTSLSDAGFLDSTFAIATIGSVLIIFGILGLALF